VVSITPRPRFTPGERAPGTHFRPTYYLEIIVAYSKELLYSVKNYHQIQAGYTISGNGNKTGPSRILCIVASRITIVFIPMDLYVTQFTGFIYDVNADLLEHTAYFRAVSFSIMNGQMCGIMMFVCAWLNNFCVI
jgi:hypothetical protein